MYASMDWSKGQPLPDKMDIVKSMDSIRGREKRERALLSSF
jgi:hypothetical protein